MFPTTTQSDGPGGSIDGAHIQQVFDPVWVTGQLAARRTDTQLANAGYTLTATDVEPYKGEQR